VAGAIQPLRALRVLRVKHGPLRDFARISKGGGVLAPAHAS
jgi:hypothetical protein